MSCIPRPAPARATPCEDAYRSSGPSPTVFLLGAGPVGQAFLRQAPERPSRLAGLADSSGIVWRRAGLDAPAWARFKAAGGRVGAAAEASPLPLEVLVDVCPPTTFVDCVGSGGDGAAAQARAAAILRAGHRLVLASKDALARDPLWFLAPERQARVGFDAVLGGTGHLLAAERAWLAPRCRGASIVANATTTAVIEELERGADVSQALATARHRGLLEGDGADDLDGWDAARKLVIVAAAVFARAVPLADVARARLAELDLDRVRARARRGATTRLVGRATADGELAVAYEELPRGASLAVPGRQVAYCYDLEGGRRRLHVGTALGPERTAQALWQDVARLGDGEVAR